MLVDERYRDVYAPQVGAHVDSLARIRALWRLWILERVDTVALVAAAQAFALSRVVLFAITYLAMALHPSVWGMHHPGSSTFWDAWYQWDARWYVRVARSGYHWQDFQHWSSVAFFPVYPLLILALVTVVPISTKLIAMVISNLLFFVALYALYRFVGREFDGKLARRSILYISLFPTALFFFAGYSESAFLLWSVLSLGAMRQRRWVWAGLWGCLAAGTRSQGLALMVPFALECWQVYGFRWREWLRGTWIALIPLSWIAFAIFMQARFENAFLFIESQRAWHRTTTWPWNGVWASLQRIPLNHIASVDPAHNLIELLSVAGFGALIAAGWRALPRSLSCYSLAVMALTLLNPAVRDGYYLPLMSSSRLCLALFPCFITLAMYGSREWVDRLYTTVAPALLALFAIVFLQGAWVA